MPLRCRSGLVLCVGCGGGGGKDPGGPRAAQCWRVRRRSRLMSMAARAGGWQRGTAASHTLRSPPTRNSHRRRRRQTKQIRSCTQLRRRASLLAIRIRVSLSALFAARPLRHGCEPKMTRSKRGARWDKKGGGDLTVCRYNRSYDLARRSLAASPSSASAY
eukprot:349687-Chlamydomonas_euryale.AAC.13